MTLRIFLSSTALATAALTTPAFAQEAAPVEETRTTPRETAVPTANATPAPAATGAEDAAQGSVRNVNAPPQSGIADIVVTARRTEESLQTTPIAVTALGTEALAVAKVENVADLQKTAPGLVVGRGSAGSDGIIFVAIRGQGNLQPILANDPAVATYIDGVYIPRPSTGLTDIEDVQRLEVLRGPQGTLFGRNTTGGALNIITTDPIIGERSSKIKMEYGRFKNVAALATVNLPVGDAAALRVTGSIRDHGGYGYNPYLGRDFNDTNNLFARGKFRYEGSGFDVTLSADWNRTRNNGQQAALETFNETNPAFDALGFTPLLQQGQLTRDDWWQQTAGGVARAPGISALPEDVQRLYDLRPFNEIEVYGFAGTINVEVGGLDLKSITAYRSSFNLGLNDTDATAAPLLATIASSKSDYFSQELQISGDITDSLNFIAGGYFGDESGYEFSRSQIFGALIRDSNADVTNRTYGLFAQAYYEITDSLRAVGGFRYTWDTRNSVLHNAQVLGLPYDAPVAGTPTGINCTVTPSEPVTADTCNQIQKAKFDYPAWNVGLDYQLNDDLFVYVATRGAAKAGGWNLRAGGLPAFAPEKVRDVEAGFKADLFDRRVRLNTALFHTWKKNNQAIVNSFVEGIGVTQYIQNNGEARIYGIEAELTVQPWEGMTISANGSLQDGEYIDGTFTESQIVAGSGCNAGGVADACLVDLSDLPLLQLPKEQFNVSATQRVPAGAGELAFTAAYAYIGAQHYNAVKAADEQPQSVKDAYAVTNQYGRVPGYGILNGRIAYTLDDPDMEIALYGLNILDKKYIHRRFSDLYNQGLGFTVAYVGDPATYGVEATFRF